MRKVSGFLGILSTGDEKANILVALQVVAVYLFLG